MRHMNRVLAPYLRKFECVYLDEILTYSKSKEEHLRHIREVLQTLRKSKIIAKLSKPESFRHEAEFLSHVVGRNGTNTSPKRSQ